MHKCIHSIGGVGPGLLGEPLGHLRLEAGEGAEVMHSTLLIRECNRLRPETLAMTGVNLVHGDAGVDLVDGVADEGSALICLRNHGGTPAAGDVRYVASAPSQTVSAASGMSFWMGS